MTATVIEHDLTELIDFDAVVPCAYQECEQEATHRGRLSCGCNATWCSPHTDLARRESYIVHFWECGECGATLGYGPLGKFLRIEPL